MKLLITGGYGFIGSNFIRYMLNKYENIQIINIDNLSYGSNINNLKDIENDKRYKFIKGDLINFNFLSKLIKEEEVNAIVNIAAETHVDRSISNPRLFLESNTIGTFNLLEAVRNNNPNIRIIHVSTDEVYSDILIGSYKEEDRLKPSSPYAASKASADMFCLAYHRTYGLDVIITRCTNNFGPYQFPEKFIPKTIIRAILNMKIPIYGSGKNIRDWIYVLDHCEALDLILNKGKSGEIYNISSNNEIENIKIAEMILDIMNKNKDLIEFVEDRPGHDIRYSLDSSKIRKELNWEPKYNFKDSLEKTIEWYLNNEWWWKPLINEKILHPTPWKIKW
ncbi:MAG: dTDP-glucose 4,6-dehydratase [Candidatus Methanomethylicaceae archaeon]